MLVVAVIFGWATHGRDEGLGAGIVIGFYGLMRYLGLKFKIKGKIHYGWARLSVEASNKPYEITAVLTGYAYETIPGKAIIAGATKGPDDIEPTASFTTPTPEPVTLGALAMGAPGLAIWREKTGQRLLANHRYASSQALERAGAAVTALELREAQEVECLSYE
jgi:hypothetical protein